jgi:hypothetical protein
MRSVDAAGLVVASDPCFALHGEPLAALALPRPGGAASSPDAHGRRRVRFSACVEGL